MAEINVVDELQRADELRQRGVISQQEYESFQARLTSSPEHTGGSAVPGGVAPPLPPPPPPPPGGAEGSAPLAPAPQRWETRVLVSTMNDIPGYEITEVLGEVFGLTVRSRNVGSQFGAAVKALVGGELRGMTKNLAASRYEVMTRMVEEAVAKGADAVLAFRFDTSEMGGNWTEICAYGTAVRCRKL